MLEVVAGIVEDGEEDDNVLRREAREEAGCEIGRVVPVAAKPRTVRIRSDAPTPQLAPKAIGGFGSFSTISAIAAEVTPIMVRPAVSNLIEPHLGLPDSRGASLPARYSSAALLVSTQRTESPPAFRPSAC